MIGVLSEFQWDMVEMCVRARITKLESEIVKSTVHIEEEREIAKEIIALIDILLDIAEEKRD